MPETTAVEAPAKAATPEKKVEDAKAAEGTPKSSPTKGNPTLAEAFQLLASGKRNLLVNDVAAAVDALATSCQLFGEVYGEGAVECAEAYFVYGKALLEISRLENGVLENGLEGVPDEDTEDSSAEDDKEEKPKDKDDSMIGNPDKCTDDEKKEIVEEVGKALEENAKDLEEKLEAKKKAEEEEAAKKKAEEAKTNGDSTDGQCTSKANGDAKDEKANGDAKEEKTNGHAETNGTNGHKTDDKENADEEDKENAEGEEDSQDEENESQDGQESIGSNEAGSSAKKDGVDKSEVEKEDEDEPSNLQLAWEILELAKVCYTKYAASLGDNDAKRLEAENKLSETYQLLGEASIENEDYQKACEDLTSCLKRRQELMPEDSRCIAETHYQLGVALGFNLQFDDSVTSFNDAIAVLEKRISNLKEKKESKDPSSTNDAFYTREREITEIEKLLPEIKEKIADTRDMEKETSKKLGDKVIGATEGENGSAAFKSPEKKAEENGASSSSSKGKSPAVTNGKATSDIQMMVKKRKKSDAEEKKENGENGTSTEKAEENGKSEEPSTKKAHIEPAAAEPEAAKSS